MRLPIPRGSWRRITAIAVGLAALTSTALIVMSFEGTGILHIPKNHPTGHVHDHGNQTWPPQPPGRTKVKDLSDPHFEQNRQARQQKRFAELEQAIPAGSRLAQALGQKFRRISITDEKEKNSTQGTTRFTYFSQDNNLTVEVLFDGSSIQSFKLIDPREYQPEITDEEIADAVDLARSYFLSVGLARVQTLTAYGILAYRPEGKGFYDSRVIYVSFHAGEDAPPKMIAWVDLTNRTILNAREER